MSLQLKTYQQDCLDALAQYLARANALKSAARNLQPRPRCLR